ncbi:MAG: alpha/beta fold hydrolase [Clostridiales bacterium]|nr:alpha/beta fold hydrolase [Clostridiales bacterium]
MKKWLAVIFALCMLVSSALADTQERALQAAQQLIAGDYAALCAQFDENMRSAVDEAALEAGFASIAMQLGACTGVAGVQADDASGTAAVALAHEHGLSVLSLAFDAQGRIASMYIAPQSTAPQALSRALPDGAQALPVTLFEGTDHALMGELIMPAAADETTPYVVFAHGSGPSDLDETIGGNKPFRDLAYDLAALGVGSLRHDKITYSHPQRPCETVEQEYLESVMEALRVLKAQTGAEAVYLIGHSEGGMLTPWLTENCGFDGGVSLAGTPLALWEISLAQNLAVIEAMPEAQRAQLLAQIESEKEKGLRLAQMSREEAAQETVFGMPGAYLWHMAQMDQAKIALDSEKPYLFLWGECDFQVNRDAFEAWHESLGDEVRFRYITYPGLNHLFMPAGENDSILNAQAAYAEPKQMDDRVAADIATWINEN